MQGDQPRFHIVCNFARMAVAFLTSPSFSAACMRPTRLAVRSGVRVSAFSNAACASFGRLAASSASPSSSYDGLSIAGGPNSIGSFSSAIATS